MLPYQFSIAVLPLSFPSSCRFTLRVLHFFLLLMHSNTTFQSRNIRYTSVWGPIYFVYFQFCIAFFNMYFAFMILLSSGNPNSVSWFIFFPLLNSTNTSIRYGWIFCIHQCTDTKFLSDDLLSMLICTHIFIRTSSRFSPILPSATFQAATLIPSFPDAFPFLKFFIALITLFFSITPSILGRVI